MGDTDAAQAALTAAEEMANNAQSTVSSGSDVVSAARENLQTNFNVKVFQLILLIAAGLAAFMLVFSMVMFVVHRKVNGVWTACRSLVGKRAARFFGWARGRRAGRFFCSHPVHIPYIHPELSTAYNGYPPWKC